MLTGGDVGYRDRRWTGLLLGVILVLAFVLRLIFVCQVARGPLGNLLVMDSRMYHEWAIRIGSGGWIGKEVFHALPLYPYVLGFIYSFLGPHLLVAKFLQIALGTFNCYLLFRLGDKLFSRGVGLLASLLMAAYAWLIVYDAMILPTVLAIFLNLSSLLCVLSLAEGQKHWGEWLGTGCLLGLAVLADAHILPFVILCPFWLWFTDPPAKPRSWFHPLSLLVVGIAVVVGSVTVRNALVGKDFIPLTSHGGINFFIGNHPQADGMFSPPSYLRSGTDTLQRDAAAIAQKATGRLLRPSEISAYWFGQGINFIKNQPMQYLRLLLQKCALFCDSTEIPDVVHPDLYKEHVTILELPLPTFGMIMPLALTGCLVLLWLRFRMRSDERKKGLVLLYLFLLTFAAANVLYFINARYRLPVVPILLVFAAFLISWWCRQLRNRAWIAVAAPLPLLILCVLLVNPSIAGRPRITLNMGAHHNHLGGLYLGRSDLDRALKEFKKARDMEPYREEAHYNLARVHHRRGEYDQAIEGYRKALAINPFNERAHLAIASILEEQENTGKAELKYREIIANLPDCVPAYLQLAHLVASQDRTAEAADVLERAIQVAPRNPDVHYHLGGVYYLLGRGADAARELSTAQRLGEKITPGQPTEAWCR